MIFLADILMSRLKRLPQKLFLDSKKLFISIELKLVLKKPLKNILQQINSEQNHQANLNIN